VGDGTHKTGVRGRTQESIWRCRHEDAGDAGRKMEGQVQAHRTEKEVQDNGVELYEGRGVRAHLMSGGANTQNWEGGRCRSGTQE
jgi:hypothetical protein